MNTIVFIGRYAEGDRLSKAISFQKKNSPSLSGVVYSRNLWGAIKKKEGSAYSVSIFPSICFPHGKALYIKDRYWDGERLSFSYCNIILLRNISAYFHLLRSIRRSLLPELKKENGPITIINAEVWGPSVRACSKLKKSLPGSKLITILPDLPQFTNRIAKNKLFLFLKKKDASRVTRIIEDSSDGVVLFSKNMEKYLSLGQIPHIVHEGILPPRAKPRVSPQKGRIVFTGSLDEQSCRLGLLFEVIALLESKNPGAYSLHLAGSGFTTVSMEQAKGLPVYFHGTLAPDDLIQLQESAEMFISLRPNTPEFNAAFPSKLFEYISFEKPIVCTSMDVFPARFKKYAYICPDERAEGIANTISGISLNRFANDPEKKEAYRELTDYYSADHLLKLIESIL